MAEANLPPIKIIDYQRCGELIFAWSQDPSTAPQTIEDLRKQLNGIAEVPDRFKKLIVVQGDDETFVLRLPPKNQARESRELLDKEGNTPAEYGNPVFYDILRDGKGFDNKSFILNRIADYTLAACR